jgi:hypothetical protein
VRDWLRITVRRALVSAGLVAAVAVLAACSGKTTGATSVTSTSATLNAVGSCDTACTAYMRWRVVGTTTWTNAPSFSVDHPVTNAAWSQSATGLFPGTRYEYQACGKESSYAQFACAGPSGTDGTTDTFSTPSGSTAVSITAQPALSPTWDPSITDYVTRCGGGPVTMRVSARSGAKVAIDGRSARGGNFTQDVALALGQEFRFTTTVSGQAQTFFVRCLPGDFPAWTYSRTGRPSQQWTLLGINKGNGRYVTFFDADGVPLWWYSVGDAAIDARLLSDGTVAYAESPAAPFGTNTTAYKVRRLDGTLVRTLKAVGTDTDHHDLQQMPNGDFLLISYRPRDHVDLSAFGGPSDATVLDGEIQEITASGTLVWSWNSKDHVALEETDSWWPFVRSTPLPLPDGRSAYDIVHVNAVEPDGDGLLISLRHTNAVYRISLADGHVEWKLGGTQTPQSVAVSGDTTSTTFSGQHDVRRLADGTVTIHDNGTQLNRPPRAVRFRIDPAASTATLVESVSDPEVTASPCCGSARKLDSNGWLMGWGAVTNPVIAEYAASGSRLFKLQFPDSFSYRAFPVPAGRITAQQLRQGMDTMFPR